MYDKKNMITMIKNVRVTHMLCALALLLAWYVLKLFLLLAIYFEDVVNAYVLLRHVHILVEIKMQKFSYQG